MILREATRLLARRHLQPDEVEAHIREKYGALLSRHYQGARDFQTCHAVAQAAQIRRAARMVREAGKIGG